MVPSGSLIRLLHLLEMTNTVSLFLISSSEASTPVEVFQYPRLYWRVRPIGLAHPGLRIDSVGRPCTIEPMDIQDIIFDPSAPQGLRREVFEYMLDENLGAYTRVLVPTESNDDINGSQHASGGGTDFTYRDATDDDLQSVSTLGYYEYFSSYRGAYTGHYYEGDGDHFEALVLNPPAYAASRTV